MRRNVLGGVAVALTAFASRAEATNYCFTSGGFSACASANIVVNGGLTQLEVSIQNLSGVVGNTAWGLTGFGLYYLVPPNYTGTVALSSGPTGWVNGVLTSLQNPGPQGTEVWLGGANNGGSAPNSLVGCSWFGNPTVISTCGGPVTFTFNLTAGANFSLSALNIAFRGQSWTDLNGTAVPAGSFKCYSSDPTCQPPTNVVPEPATMMLLATGLVSLTAAGAMRRRRKDKPTA